MPAKLVLTSSTTGSEVGRVVEGIPQEDEEKADDFAFRAMSLVKRLLNRVEPTVVEIKKCLDGDSIPNSNPDCEYCEYGKLIKSAGR